MGLEIGVFALAALLMGWIGRRGRRRSRHRAAACRRHLHGAAGARARRRRFASASRLAGATRAGITRAGWTAWVLGTVFMGVMALGMWSAPHRLVTLFLDRRAGKRAGDRPRGQLPQGRGAFQLVDGAQVIGAGMLRGLHDTRWPLIFALVGYWVVGLGIGAWLAFGRDWRGVGIWTGLASGLAAVAVTDARPLADARPARADDEARGPDPTSPSPRWGLED